MTLTKELKREARLVGVGIAEHLRSLPPPWTKRGLARVYVEAVEQEARRFREDHLEVSDDDAKVMLECFFSGFSVIMKPIHGRNFMHRLGLLSSEQGVTRTSGHPSPLTLATFSSSESTSAK